MLKIFNSQDESATKEPGNQVGINDHIIESSRPLYNGKICYRYPVLYPALTFQTRTTASYCF